MYLPITEKLIFALFLCARAIRLLLFTFYFLARCGVDDIPVWHESTDT